MEKKGCRACWAGNVKGVPKSEEFKRKLSIAKTGTKMPRAGVLASALKRTGRKASIETREKQSLAHRVFPPCSFRGYCGWFHGESFRSLPELSFLIFLKKYSIPYISIESLEYRVPYIDETGARRGYHGDFLLWDHVFVEIKPRKLCAIENNQKKFEGAISFCKEKGWHFKIVDPVILDKEIWEGFKNGSVVFGKTNRLRIEKWAEKRGFV